MKTSNKGNGSIGSLSGTHLVTDRGKEFFWGCELTKAKPSVTWSFEEEDDDLDYMEHTLFLRQAVLGGNVKPGERHVVEVETLNFAGEKVIQPIISMVAGKADMCQLNLNFGHEVPVTFKLLEGSGPIYLSALHVVQFPAEDEELVAVDTETEEENENEIEIAKAKKRKANGVSKGTKKRGKFDAKSDEEEEEDDDDEEKDYSLGESEGDDVISKKQEDDSKDDEPEESMEEDEGDDDDDDDDYVEKPQKKGRSAKKKAPKSAKVGKSTPKPSKKVAKRKMTK